MTRLAGAPISWGVCEVPGWGHQMSPDRVLGEMCATGLAATEFGPEGFLPDAPDERHRLLAAHGLQAVGGFVPVVLHREDHDPVADVRHALAGFGSATTLVLAAATGTDGYDSRPVLDAAGWRTLLTNLTRVDALARAAGVHASLHPHVGTMVERGEEIERVLDNTGVLLCLDTGHLLVGGVDPTRLARRVPRRIGHVHLKDVDGDLAERVLAGVTDYTDAVRRGVFRPLGQGDVDLGGIVEALGAVDYDGWYVLEQDTVLTGEPPAGAGPVDDVVASLRHLREIMP